jgi:hypothetical protein
VENTNVMEHDNNSSLRTVSPQQIDMAIQKQGQDLHKLLQVFKQAATEPLSSFILQTLQHKSSEPKMKSPVQSKSDTQKSQRKSPRLQEKDSKSKSIVKKA